MRKFPAVKAKHRRTTYICPPFFANWLAALYFGISSLCLECGWQQNLIGQVGAGMLRQILQRKQAPVISLNIKSVQ